MADPAEAVREARARARRRLMGATVLLVIGVIGFPLLFETQPRPIPVDLPIDIPARNANGSADGSATSAGAGHGGGASMAAGSGGSPAVAATALAASGIRPESVTYDAHPAAPIPLPAPSAAASSSRSAFASIAAALIPGGGHASQPAARTAPDAVAATATTVPDAAPVVTPAPTPTPTPTPTSGSKPAVEPPAKPAAAAAIKPIGGPEGASGAKVAAKPPAKPASHPLPGTHGASSPSGATAAALLAGGASPKASEPAAGGARFVVQIGAFADDNKLHDVRGKVERIGLKTYTQAVDTPAGKRVRVRVGPFATRADADKAAARIKGGGLPAAVLTL